MNAPSPALEVVLASDNAGKLAEFGAILGAAGIRMHPQGELGVAPAEEPHLTFVENALAKARHASRQTGLPALADDSGLCVPALGNAPGVFSARWSAIAGGVHSDAANNARLVTQLQAHDDRRACFVAVLVLVRHAEDPVPFIAQGLWHGEILAQPRGARGFGYDPLFYVPALGCTAAELSPADKNRHSHRGRALRRLLQELQDDSLLDGGLHIQDHSRNPS
ncbi:MAG: RdgB/HAM1 family non-canonical purine NTP pyrophosphatase [Castellaniella sp.]